MIVTENVARSLSCVRDQSSYCRGSLCMAWSWGARGANKMWRCADPRATIEPPRPAGVPADARFYPFTEDDGETACWLESDESVFARRTGVCGLLPFHGYDP